MGIVELLLLPFVFVMWFLSTLFGAIYALLVLITAIWAFLDARARDRSGCLVGLFVLVFFWPVGLLLWLVLRPGRGYRD